MILRERFYAANEGDEYCPRCDANLTLQMGYSNDVPYWLCKGCGEMLINPGLNAEFDIVWFCDGCESVLNEQENFSEDCGTYKCVKCGYLNKIDVSEVFYSKEEHLAAKNDPYAGLSDEDLLGIMSYEEISNINGRDDIYLVRENHRLYVKKLLKIFNESVYDYLKIHPIANMPRIIDTYRSKTSLIIIEEYIEGSTLAEILADNVLPVSEAVRIIISLCSIINELHSQHKPIVHRDIKPSNIMITKSGQVVLLDVNVAKWYDPEETQDTVLFGTVNYAAPEQAGFGMKASSVKTDIYAVGILLNQMITGKLPKEKHVHGQLWDIIKRCIALDANERYTASELIALLDVFMKENYGREENQ